MPKTYEVIVGNIGTVYEGPHGTTARAAFREYVHASKQARGRAAGEQVAMFEDGEPVKEYVPADWETTHETNPAFSIKEEPIVHKELLAFLNIMQDTVQSQFAPKRIKVSPVIYARGDIYEVFWRHHRIARIAPRGRTPKGVLTVQVDPDWREFPATMLKGKGIPGFLRTDDADKAAAYILVLLGIIVSIDSVSSTTNPRMGLREFIRSNRDEIDAGIRRALDRPDYRLNDEERRQWVLNDEGLYLWARREGVRI